MSYRHTTTARGPRLQLVVLNEVRLKNGHVKLSPVTPVASSGVHLLQQMHGLSYVKFLRGFNSNQLAKVNTVTIVKLIMLNRDLFFLSIARASLCC